MNAMPDPPYRPTPASAPVAEDVRDPVGRTAKFQCLTCGTTWSPKNPIRTSDEWKYTCPLCALEARLHPQEPEPARAEPDAEVRRVLENLLRELKALTEGEACDHDVGVCWCSAFGAIDAARALLQRLSAPPPEAEPEVIQLLKDARRAIWELDPLKDAEGDHAEHPVHLALTRFLEQRKLDTPDSKAEQVERRPAAGEPRTSIELDIPTDPAERIRRQDEWNRQQRSFGELPRAPGISRMSDNDQAILLHFERRLTDDEMRQLHDAFRGVVS